MIKLQTGISTDMDFIKAMKERGLECALKSYVNIELFREKNNLTIKIINKIISVFC